MYSLLNSCLFSSSLSSRWQDVLNLVFQNWSSWYSSHRQVLIGNYIPAYFSAILVILTFLHVLQYLSRFINTKWQIFDRFAVMFSVAIVWLFAQILTSSGVYDNKPASTQMSCCTDRSGLLAASPWWDFSLVYANYDCQQVISVTVSWISLTAVDLLVLWFCHKHAGYIFHIHFNGEAPLSMQEKLLQWLLPL